MRAQSSAVVLIFLLAAFSQIAALAGEKQPYTEMPDVEFLDLFGEFEFCRNPLIHSGQYVEELRKSVSEDKAKKAAHSEKVRCKSLGGNGTMIARFMGYDMPSEVVTTPGFWNHLDQVRARSGAQ